MKTRFPNFLWIGIAVAAAYWVTESLIHTLIFGSGPIMTTLLGEHDPNELWMRLLLSILFAAFGWIADRTLRAERRLRFDSERLNRMLRYVDKVNKSLQGNIESIAPHLPEVVALQLTNTEVRMHDDSPGDSAPADDPFAGNLDSVGALGGMLRELSLHLDIRFKELYVLLQLTHEINMGLLLDEVLEKAYVTFRSVIPYDRLSVALLENDGAILRARWVHSNGSTIRLGQGYWGEMKGSSLQTIIATGEPRILNDLAAYLQSHPKSNSTRTIVSEGIRSSLTCPLISMGKPIGFIFFSSTSTNTYRDVHVDIFKLIAGHLSVVVEKSNLYQQVLFEKEKSESLLLNVMPARIANRLREGETTIAESHSDIAVLFADIVRFTDFAGRYTPEQVVGVLQDIFTRWDKLCDRYDIEKIKTIGDCYMAMCVPTRAQTDDHLRNIARFAIAIREELLSVYYPDGTPVRIRIGLHAGPAVAGVIGQKKFAYDIWGDTVNVASRMQAAGLPGEIQVSNVFQQRLATEFSFENRGDIEIKGKGKMKTYLLKQRIEAEVSEAIPDSPPL